MMVIRMRWSLSFSFETCAKRPRRLRVDIPFSRKTKCGVVGMIEYSVSGHVGTS